VNYHGPGKINFTERNTMTKPQKILKAQALVQAEVERLKLALLPTVVGIENGPELTRGHYGEYMTILNTCKGDKFFKSCVAQAMIQAGGNKEGVDSALRLAVG
jgi:hypothetical protein